MRYRTALHTSHTIYTIAAIGFIYSLHLVLPIYSNAAFLGLFATEKTVGLIYMMGSAMTILGFLFIPIFIRKAGNYTVALWLVLLQIFFMYGLATSSDPRWVAVFFVLQVAAVALLGFCLDIFLEVYSRTNDIGRIRGLYLTTMNCAWVIAPLVGSLLIGVDDYRNVYMAALLILFPLFYLIWKNFPRFKDPHYEHPSVHQTFAHILKNPNHSRLFVINIILQTFYAWMIVYSTVYLHNVVGLTWAEIGIILTIMLIPFATIEYPLGKLADRKYGEKEIMILGFALLGLSTMALAAIVSTNVWVWALAFLITRIGAAAVEIMIETYFFKTTSPKDSSTLGFFRITRSLSFFIAPLITGAVFLVTKEQGYLFIVIGLMCLIAIIPALRLKDTK